LRGPGTGRRTGTLLIAGLVGAAAMNLVTAAGVLADLTPWNLELVIGSVLTRRGGTLTWYVGLVAHVLISMAMACLYGLALDRWGGAGAGRGLVLAVPHALAAGVVLWLAGPLLPSVGDPALADPGFLAAEYGAWATLNVIVAHLAYGATVGAVYAGLCPRPPACDGD
jgi:hypothetical protein